MRSNRPLTLPPALVELANERWLALQAEADFDPQLAAHQQLISPALALSDFIHDQIMRYPKWLMPLLQDKQLFEPDTDYQALLQHALKKVENEVQLHQALRQFRHFHMLGIAWRDLLNMQSIETSLAQVSELARQLINQANTWLYHALTPRLGTPQGEHGPQPMLILGMGKLGGNELNFSSDIDLIFTYPSSGDTTGGRKVVENQQFFTKLAQKLITALNQITAHGQVYRVDMRLRPFGDSGPLVMHFDAMEDYYQEQGRDWERYAMLKGAILNPPCAYSQELSAILKPFIYRRYLDFSAIESLRSMKSMIEQEVRRRGLTNNIKLGQGGIREAEFVVQSLQLINGGREPSLQQQSLQLALDELVKLDILPTQSAATLKQSYFWLRKVEHTLQQIADQQTQELPADELNKLRLTTVLGLSNEQAFMRDLALYTGLIHQQFSLLVKEDAITKKEKINENQQASIDLWQLDLSLEEVSSILQQWGLSTSDSQTFEQEFYQQLTDFKQHLTSNRVGQRGLTTLHHLMPTVLQIILDFATDDHPQLLKRVLKVLKAVLGRTAYLQLLLENQGALFHLVKLCEASPWVTKQIARFPLLLDELLNPATLYQPVEMSQYVDELRQIMLRVEPHDLELQIETLRQFKLSQQLKIAAADIAGGLPIMKVSDHLTYLAEVLIAKVVDIAWQQMTTKYGVPVCTSKGPKNRQDKGFAVIGYGKLGGWELGYGSDLDLVFVHNCDGQLTTRGPKEVETRSFYLKLAQRILHIFTITTGLGQLYEVDMRLRPSGNAGLLVSHIDSFASYQQESAWTWEHQALGRARFITGEQALYSQFSDIRLQVLANPRDQQSLTDDVVAMREKMRKHLATGNDKYFDLKQDQGGIADIEFLVQFMLLAHTQKFNSLARWPDNVRILAELAKLNLLSEQEADILTQAYLDYRHTAHKLALQDKKRLKLTSKLSMHRDNVVEIWQKYLALAPSGPEPDTD